MKYTRYDIRKKTNTNYTFILIFFSMLIFAVIIATVISNFAFKKSDIIKPSPSTQTNAANSSDKNTTSQKTVKYIAVQGGMFAKPEGVDKVKNILSGYGNPFTVKEEKGTRVFLGIYSEEEGSNIMKQLIDKNVENSKMLFEVNIDNNPCNKEITAIISAELDTLSQLADKNTDHIKTDDLKKWCSELKEVDKSSKNITLLNDLKNHINSFPKELHKDKVPEYYAYDYDLLKKLIN